MEISESLIHRVSQEYLDGQLTIGCYVETPEGRYQVVAIERSTDPTNDGPIPHVTMTLYREPVLPDRIEFNVVQVPRGW